MYVTLHIDTIFFCQRYIRYLKHYINWPSFVHFYTRYCRNYNMMILNNLIVNQLYYDKDNKQPMPVCNNKS